MVLYNRKKRRVYFAEQAELHSRTLAEAQIAEREGRASELQLAFLASEREKEGIRAEAERAEREREMEGGWGKRAKKWLVGGLKSEDVGAVEGGLVAREEGVEDEGGSKVGILRQVEEMQREETGFTRLTNTKEGGMPDRIGEEAARDLGERKRSWTSWVTGR
ncbi:MAG: hypothetical protein M1824_000845 [Vezdaea acicularis]|nr:MAG: hypothetical protein M1824_000845 [Vezdaea acicularis]